jgi:hypothetical protein
MYDAKLQGEASIAVAASIATSDTSN